MDKEGRKCFKRSGKLMNIDRRSDKKHGGWGNREKNEEEKKVERQRKKR